MICKQYQKLTIVERYQLYGKMQHLVENDAAFYSLVVRLIKQAEKDGLLDNVIINPPWSQAERVDFKIVG